MGTSIRFPVFDLVQSEVQVMKLIFYNTVILDMNTVQCIVVYLIMWYVIVYYNNFYKTMLPNDV